MKRCFLFLAILLFLCPNIWPQKYTWQFSLLEPTPSDALVYSDEFIDIAFSFDVLKDRLTKIDPDLINRQFGFIIQNKTDTTIKINWDELSWIYPDGNSARVVHSGTKFAKTTDTQVPSVIPPSAKVSDFLIPADDIWYSDSTDERFSGWNVKWLFKGKDINWDGKEFRVYFPLEIKGSKKEYLFKFKVNVTQAPKKKKK